MKKIYQNPTIKVVKIQNRNLLTQSINGFGGAQGGTYDNGISSADGRSFDFDDEE